MENTLSKTKNYKLDYHGQGTDLFAVMIVNWLLTAVTLGIYHPWAKAKQLQYFYKETSLNNERFTFHGTGKEMFRGFIIAFVFFAMLFSIAFGLIALKMQGLGIIVLYAGLIAVLPIAIHGSYKYRMSRTSWRGIRFGYRGDRKELTINFFKWIGLTLITIGIYSSWMTINLRKYLVSNVRFGEAEFDYQGDGGEYFWLFIKGYLLTLITFGIYIFWWQKDIFDYYINNLSLHKNEEKIEFESTVTAGGIFELTIINVLLIVFTLGLGSAWAETRTMKFLLSNIHLEGDLDLDNIKQTEADYKDATGEDLGDILDMDFVM